ncbi:MAG: glycine--tRNA ligase subunit beta, partial [bacterium]
LLTGVVGEFPELQGIMGGEYAKHDGESEKVWKAIRDQYLPRGMDERLPETVEGKVLSLADRLDTIVAFFRAGIIPRGSEDPYSLRRHALSIVRIIIEGKLKLNLDELVEKSDGIVGEHINNSSSMLNDPLRFIFERFRFYTGALHVQRDDVMSAVCETADKRTPLDLVDLLDQMKALQAVTVKPEFDPLIVGFKRAQRLVEKEKNEWVRQPVNPALFQHPHEFKLREAWEKNNQLVGQLLVERKYPKALESLVRMKPAIDDFFTAVMVNADDPSVRSNRLSLLKDIDELFLLFADFSQIVVQGEGRE